MIQRKQTLFLLLVMLVSASLAIVNCNFLVLKTGGHMGVSVSIIPTNDIRPNIWHYSGTFIIFLSISLALVITLLFKSRNLQLKLCYVLMLLQLALTGIVSFCPVVDLNDITHYENSGFASILGILSMMSAYLAARYIKKDIELLKSTDRIR